MYKGRFHFLLPDAPYFIFYEWLVRSALIRSDPHHTPHNAPHVYA